MAAADLQIVIQAVDKASRELSAVSKSLKDVEKEGGGLTKRFGAVRNSIKGMQLPIAAAGFTALGGAIAYSVKQAADAQKVQAQLSAVLKSTKGVAGVTADEVNNLAEELQQLTPYSDEAIVSAESLLLTFTKISDEVFPQATETVLDMSTALGQDLKSSAIQLGKALNDPITGMTALRRVGVSFTESQQDQIKALQKSGDLLGAQKLILQELQTEFGGAARAAGETFGGQLAILRNNLDEIAETVGGAILPILSDATEQLNSFLVDHRGDIEEFAEVFATDLAGGIEATAEGIAVLVDLVPRLNTGLGDLEVLGIAAAGALAFLFPQAALIAGLVAIVATIGLLNLGTEDASDNALKFKASWLNAVADVIDGVAGLNETIASAPFKVFEKLALGGPGGPLLAKGSEEIRERFIEEQSIFRVESEKLRRMANESLQEVDDRLAESWVNGNMFASGIKNQGSSLGDTTTRADKYATTLEEVQAQLEGTTGEARTLSQTLDALFDERTLADITLERQLADIDALISQYRAAGTEIPADLEAMRDALQDNERASDDLARAASLNFEEIRARLVLMGADGEIALQGLTEKLEALPEEERIEVITQLNQGGVAAVEAYLAALERRQVVIDVISRISSALPGARPRAEGGVVRRPELALIGEDGPEAVLPLNKPARMNAILREIGISPFANGFVPQGESGTGDGPYAVITINAPGGNGADIAREVRKVLRDDLGMDTLSGPRLPAGSFSPRRA